MIVMENSPEVASFDCKAELCVERTDISFEDVAQNRVRIRVRVQNVGAEPSVPTPLMLESAPLGAFAPWQALGQMIVPALEPGESRELSMEADRPRPTPLGDFDRIPPRQLLTALNAPDDASPRPASRPVALMEFLRRARGGTLSGRATVGRTSLAPDLWDLVGRGQPYWAGNINVFIGHRPVERHVAKALRIYPGRMNLAMFIVGDPGRRDAYTFELAGLAPGWEAGLYDSGDGRSLLVDPGAHPLEEGRWVESTGGMLMLLSTRPPADCHTGNLEVHVTQRSSGKTATVEFNLDPAAKGPGCYTV